MICKYTEILCWKNVSSFCIAKATHIFSAKNIGILYIESAKTVNEMTLNELVKLTTLWTTGPWFLPIGSHQWLSYNFSKIPELAQWSQRARKYINYTIVPLATCWCVWNNAGCVGNSIDSDQMLLCSIWSESTLFAQAWLSQYLGLLHAICNCTWMPITIF